MKRPKCSSCRKKAEFYFQKDERTKKWYFCENHGLEFMRKKNVSFLPRMKA